MILSTMAMKLFNGKKPQKQQKRDSVISNMNPSRIPRPSVCENSISVFEDTDVFQRTPMSDIIRKIRSLKQLDKEDIELVSGMDKENILLLFLEYNCSLRVMFNPPRFGQKK